MSVTEITITVRSDDPTPPEPVVRTLPETPSLKMSRYDLVKELSAGQHVVVSRKADKGMVLNIDEDTVRALSHLLEHVGGQPDSPRQFLDALREAVQEAIPESEWLTTWQVFPSGDCVEGSVMFLNDKQLYEKRHAERIKAAQRKGPIFGPGANMSEPDDAGPSFYEEL